MCAVPPSQPRLVVSVNGKEQESRDGRIQVREGDRVKLECEERHSFPAARLTFEVSHRHPHHHHRRRRQRLGRGRDDGARKADHEFTAEASTRHNGAAFRCVADNLAMTRSASATASSLEVVLEVACKRYSQHEHVFHLFFFSHGILCVFWA